VKVPPSTPLAFAITTRALAKINLHLAIHDRRPDGYHALTTVFQSIALADTVTIEAHDGPFELRCSEPGVPANRTNLAWRAAEAYAGATGRPLTGLRLNLVKHVPAQAGLGGGSADAVATLRALARCWNLDVDRDLFVRLARALGSDVPFFVEGGTALGTGRGDELTPLPDLPRFALAIVQPPFGVGTADAYRWVAEHHGTARSGGPVTVRWPAASGEWDERLAQLANDFEPVVGRRFPEIARILSTLRAAGAALALLSGSGSAVVGLFRDDTAAAGAAGQFTGLGGWRAWTSATIGRSAYEQAVAPSPAAA
jgi:4-diphosphocytidyl-2-C-methyl-D-erythritol kinase